MKHHLKFTVGGLILVLISSCGNNDLEQENDMLKNKIVQLESVIKKLEEESIIIPYDSLTSYIMPTTFHPDIKLNEEGEFQALLQWRKFPSDIEVDCKVTSGNAVISDIPSDGIYRTFEVKYGPPGENMIEGEYIITLPNGVIRTYDWRAHPNIIDS